MLTQFILGLDLGQTHDFTALAVLEQTVMAETSDLARPEYALRHLRRFPLGTPCTEIVPASRVETPWTKVATSAPAGADPSPSKRQSGVNSEASRDHCLVSM